MRLPNYAQTWLHKVAGASPLGKYASMAETPDINESARVIARLLTWPRNMIGRAGGRSSLEVNALPESEVK